MNFAHPFDLALNLPRDPALMGYEDQAHRRAFHYRIVWRSILLSVPGNRPDRTRANVHRATEVTRSLDST